MVRFYCIACLFVVLLSLNASAQDNRGQYPFLLSNSYVGVTPGYIHYNFTNDLLRPGYKAANIVNPGLALRIVLGHEFNKYVSAQISYMRPIYWLEYRLMNVDSSDYAVFMNVGGFTGRFTLPVTKRFSVYAEGGLSVVTRTGFEIKNKEVAPSTNFASYQLSGGAQYTINNRWKLAANFTFAPGKSDVKQPNTYFYGFGISYHMRPLSAEGVARNSSGGFFFPKNLMQVGFSTKALGYGLNYWFTKRPLPIFWDGDVRVAKGIALQYQQNTFHGRRFFSLDWGLNVSYFETELNKQQFFTASIFPVLRFWPLRTKCFDLYANYTLAGPTYISQKVMDNLVTGEHFTFYDAMGLGMFTGKNRNLNAEIRIAHYSNGNLFYHNPGELIPFTLNLGYTF